ncbi:MAG: SwmB domain-containing protein [Spirochaetaceae bacterium]|nr:SwmB domain-containing protein [Spirochaetaceae bacterium]
MSRRRGAAGLLGLALLLGAGTAAAQSTITLVSNTGQSRTASLVALGLTSFAHNSLAATFTTGAHAAGYTLSAVDVSFGLIGSTAVVQVSLYSTSSGAPGTSLQVLTNPASFTSDGLNTFTAAADTTLDANTTYALVVENTRTTERATPDLILSGTTSDSEDTDAATGWSIANAANARNTNDAAWQVRPDSAMLMIAIKGSAKDTTAPTLQTATVNGSTLTLTFDEALDTTTAPAASRFTVGGTDTATTVTGVAFKSGDAKSVELTVSPAVPHGDTGITVSYAKGSDANPLKDTAATPNQVADFSGETVTNNTPAPGVMPAPTVSIAGGGAITAGSPARFIVSASAAPSSNLRIGLALTSTGGVLAPWSGTIDILASATSAIFTTANTAAALSGTVTVTLLSGTGYTVSSISGSATVTVTAQQQPDPPGQDPQQPREPRPLQPKPEPLQLALWTDKPGYLAGDTVRLYRTLDPHDDRGQYSTFVYLEPAGGGQRRYLAPLWGGGQLHADAVDGYGRPEGGASALPLSSADRVLVFEGKAPRPGLWRFVLELRPGSAAEQAEEPAEPLLTRRAWAGFTVAERSVLLNRRGWDRELRADATLRSDTIYYLGHQLFVHDGATLTIEAGTVVKGWGDNTAIIVEPGGRIVAEGTREAPVVLTCSSAVGRRQPGCWGGLRILGRAPVTRLEGVAPGVLPAERAVYGGADGEGSSGALRYVRVEFAGAGGDPDDPEHAAPAIGLYGAGSGTVLDHVQARRSLGDGIAFSGGSAAGAAAPRTCTCSTAATAWPAATTPKATTASRARCRRCPTSPWCTPGPMGGTSAGRPRCGSPTAAQCGPSTCWRPASSAARCAPSAARACCSARARARSARRCCGSSARPRCLPASPTRRSSRCATRSCATCATSPTPIPGPRRSRRPCQTRGRATSGPSAATTTGSRSGLSSDPSPSMTCASERTKGTSASGCRCRPASGPHFNRQSLLC